MKLEQRVRNLPLLSEAYCVELRTKLEELRAHWIQRHPVAPFYTLGASNYFDIAHNPEAPYQRMVREFNPLLLEHFSDLYTRTSRLLADTLSMPVAYAEHLALPGFHIFEADRAFENIQGLTHSEWFERRYETSLVSSPIHCDTPHYVVDWGKSLPSVAMHRPISFTLAISMPSSGAAMYVWDLRLHETQGFDDAQIHAVVAERKRISHAYELGALAFHDGYNYHMVAPMGRAEPGESRITLQGHGVPVGGVMRLFW